MSKRRHGEGRSYPLEFMKTLLDSASGDGRTHPLTRGEHVLWRAVILQALIDATNTSLKPDALHTRNEASRWLTRGGTGFVMVCDLAGLDPDMVRRNAKQALLAQNAWRTIPRTNAARMAGSRKQRKPAGAPPAVENPKILTFPQAV